MLTSLLEEPFFGKEYYIIEPGTEKYIPIDNIINSLVLTVVVKTGANILIESTIDTPEFFALPSTQFTDMLWETIQIGGVITPSITASEPSIVFTSPSIIHIKNIGTASARLNLRGLR